MNDELTPEEKVALGDYVDVAIVVKHYEESENGRARNARIAYILAVTVLIVSIVAGVSIRGWSSATNALETRNKAVQALTEQGQRQAAVDDCQDRAFAAWLDGVLQADDIEQGVLAAYYHRCEVTDGKTYRP